MGLPEGGAVVGDELEVFIDMEPEQWTSKGEIYQHNVTHEWVQIVREPHDGVTYYELVNGPEEAPLMSMDEEVFLAEYTKIGKQVR